MKFVLIFMMYSGHFGSVSTSAEFEDKAACDVALKSIIDTDRYASKEEPHDSYILGFCFPKASK